jgi:hypothetical protein
MRGYADHHAVPGRICSSVHVARKKVSSYSNLPQYDATNLKNGIEVTDHNQPADRPAPSQKDLQEVSTLLLEQRSTLGFFHFTWIVPYVCDLLQSEPWKEVQKDTLLWAIDATRREH